MTDPRNIAHDKKVHQEKRHHGEDVAPDADHAPQPGKKPHIKHEETKGESSPTDEAGSQASPPGMSRDLREYIA